MDGIDRESMMETFIYEMNQLLEQLESYIIQAEYGYSSDTINGIFRAMHTIKGSAAMMLYNNMSSVAHAIEDLFFYIRENNPQNIDYGHVTDLVLEAGISSAMSCKKLRIKPRRTVTPRALLRKLIYT